MIMSLMPAKSFFGGGLAMKYFDFSRKIIVLLSVYLGVIVLYALKNHNDRKGCIKAICILLVGIAGYVLLQLVPYIIKNR